MAQNGFILAIGTGKFVQLIKKESIGSFILCLSLLGLLADPSRDDEQLLGKELPFSQTHRGFWNERGSWENLWHVLSIFYKTARMSC
jgi:hypothetical protein